LIAISVCLVPFHPLIPCVNCCFGLDLVCLGE
jgi:hypothetical protein